MYAVIETGGKQYRVEVGTELEVELLNVEPGQSITLERVLLVADGAEASVGTPVVDGAAVEAEVLRRDRGEKVIAFKYRPKARRRVKKGHRQELTVLRIADIRFGGKSAAEAEGKVREQQKSERERLEAAAARQAAEDAALAAKLQVGAEKAEAAEKPAKATTKKPAAKADADEAPATAASKAKTTTTKTTAKPAAKPAAKATTAKAAAPKASKAAPAKADAATDAKPKATRTKKDE
jgi:large subunit ribosomal protein L21